MTERRRDLAQLEAAVAQLSQRYKDKHPKMMAAQKRIADAAQKHGKAWGRPVGTAEDAKVIVDIGAQLVAYGSIHWAIVRHLQECQAHFDKLLGDAK